jgi:hypothetical protein
MHPACWTVVSGLWPSYLGSRIKVGAGLVHIVFSRWPVNSSLPLPLWCAYVLVAVDVGRFKGESCAEKVRP